MDDATHGVFPQVLLDAFRRDPGVAAFEHGSRVVTRAEVLELIGRFAAGLRAAGLGPGDGVAVATAVTPEGFAVQIAAQTLGCRFVGVRPGLTRAQLPYVVGEVDALVVDDTAAPELIAAATRAKVLRVGPELLRDHENPVAAGHPGDLAAVVFTSGSTGAPKGAAFDYAAVTAQWSWPSAPWGGQLRELSRAHRRFLLFGTLSSAVMLEHLGLCLLSGGTAVIPEALPDFPAVLTRLRITAALMTVPRLHQVLDLLRTEDHDLSGLRMLLVAGSPLAPHRLAEAFERVGPAMHHAYGQTETGMLTVLTAGEVARWPDALGTVGRPGEQIGLELRDDTGNVVPDGTGGEIWVRTPHSVTRYWRDEAETAAVLSDGWVRTRDLGRVDERGYVHLTGRTRDVIIVNAIIHYAGAIEQVLASHPDVDQAYVVGAPDERTGEAAHAFVVGAEGREPDAAALRTLVERELGAASVPATLTVVTTVPTLPSGKPDKRALLAAER
ncbi:class I adenylate-forming enzyme family protein [Amycolatopsis sp. H20-H5]|uniref:class I adenylate-forming enzyme family protein n=1 Tax=Amycolatopsis sp. H20-H5 TaxID=3046309 RepID=UPI002DBBCA14|nr:AMP-binding protein [Amycolatopsis sp. H20-H5]MEC3979701.1 AMP-binding protein [Amycolatopsis sp. H20-H5]